MKYIILHVLCEGQTEERFVKEVLAPYLQQFNIYPKPIILLTSKKENSRDTRKSPWLEPTIREP